MYEIRIIVVIDEVVMEDGGLTGGGGGGVLRFTNGSLRMDSNILEVGMADEDGEDTF